MQRNENTDRPMGVLSSLMAGFEMLAHNWWLLALPVLMDLFFWMGPQLSVAPLIRQGIAFLKSQPNAEAAPWLTLMVQALEQFGEQFNLFSLLSTLPLLSPPSLLAQYAPGAISPIGERAVLPITNMLTLTEWGIVLVPAGLLLGFVYLHLVASRIHILRSPEEKASDPQTQEASTKKTPGCNIALKLIRVLLFTAGLMVIGTMLLPIWLTVLAVASAIADILLLLTFGLSLGVINFAVLHLLFVVHGVLLGERGLLRAILESIMLIRTNFPSAMGLVLAIMLIYQGLGFIWSMPAGDSWLLLIGILGNSCIATALITGTFVFYQERIHMLTGATPPATT